MQRFLLSALMMLLPVGGLSAAGFIVVSDPFDSSRPVSPADVPFRGVPGRVLEMVSHEVDVTVNDQFATTLIKQSFRNPTPRRLEGTFLFPVPKGAQLKTFTMEINGKPMEAELLAAGKARAIYEDIVRRQRDPALLEYVDRDLYKVRIFPIEPHETKRITISYGQLLTSEAGLVSFRYPMSVEKFSSKPIDKVSLNLSLKTTKPLKTIYSPTHEVEIIRDGKSAARVGYETAGSRAEQDFELFYSREEEGVGMSLLTFRPNSSEDGYCLLLASPGEVEEPESVMPKDVVFVVDTSGSMAGGKLDQAKKALAYCVDNLNEKDRFEIIRFATDVSPLFKGMRSADADHRRAARSYIARLAPKGGTAIDDALKLATALPDSEGRPFIIVFMTDGLPTVGEQNIDTIVRNATGKKDSSKRIFCFGIGNDVNTHLLDRITEETRAASQYVLPNEDLEVKVSGFFAKIKDPVLAKPVIEFPKSADVRLTYPSPLPDLFSGEQLVLVGRYAGSGKGAVALSGRFAGRTRNFAEDVAFDAASTDNEFIARLWATRRIGWLINEIRLRGESAELKEEITELARDHGIVTPYTAWLIVEDEQRRGIRPELQTLRQTPANRAALNFSQVSVENLSRQQSGQEATMSARYGARAATATVAAPSPAPRDSAEYDDAFLVRYGLSNKAAEPARVGGGGGIAANQIPTPSAVPTRSLPSSAPNVRTTPQVLPSDLARQSQVMAGKTFFQNGDIWMDSEIQKHPDARRVKVPFNSDEYFELLRRNSRLAKWATIGPKLQFYFDGSIYEIE